MTGVCTIDRILATIDAGLAEAEREGTNMTDRRIVTRTDGSVVEAAVSFENFWGYTAYTDGGELIVAWADDREASAPRQLIQTANGYLLCSSHAEAWRRGGNDVSMWPANEQETELGGGECCDCLCERLERVLGDHGPGCDGPLNCTCNPYPDIDAAHTGRDNG